VKQSFFPLKKYVNRYKENMILWLEREEMCLFLCWWAWKLLSRNKWRLWTQELRFWKRSNVRHLLTLCSRSTEKIGFWWYRSLPSSAINKTQLADIEKLWRMRKK
jgi:hypothetical protein